MTTHEVALWSGPSTRDPAMRPVDLTDSGAVESALAADDPAVVIHAAAVSTADRAFREPRLAHAVNVVATGRIADWCVGRGRRLILVSTDLVFDGRASWRREQDPAQPILEYGRTKRAAEELLDHRPGCLSARLSLLYGPTPCKRPSFFDQAMGTLRAGIPQAFFIDEYRTPLDYASAAAALVALALSDLTGLVHVGGPERLSRFDLMRRAARALGIDPKLVLANHLRDIVFPEPRPADVSLDSSLFVATFPSASRPKIEQALEAP